MSRLFYEIKLLGSGMHATFRDALARAYSPCTSEFNFKKHTREKKGREPRYFKRQKKYTNVSCESRAFLHVCRAPRKVARSRTAIPHLILHREQRWAFSTTHTTRSPHV